MSDTICTDGMLPDFEGKPIEASCINCRHNEDISDGPEYSNYPWRACTKRGKEHMSNLKGFPFSTPQKCCELNIAFTVDWDKVAREEIEKEKGH